MTPFVLAWVCACLIRGCIFDFNIKKMKKLPMLIVLGASTEAPLRSQFVETSAVEDQMTREDLPLELSPL